LAGVNLGTVPAVRIAITVTPTRQSPPVVAGRRTGDHIGDHPRRLVVAGVGDMQPEAPPGIAATLAVADLAVEPPDVARNG